jgi:hypothetical protein
MEAARSFKIYVSYCNTTWCHNPEGLKLNLITMKTLNLESTEEFYLTKMSEFVSCDIKFFMQLFLY